MLTRRGVEPAITVARARFVWLVIDMPGGTTGVRLSTVLSEVCVTAASGAGRSVLFAVDHPGVVILESGPDEPTADLRVK